jgi:hypothetical protein
MQLALETLEALEGALRKRMYVTAVSGSQQLGRLTVDHADAAGCGSSAREECAIGERGLRILYHEVDMCRHVDGVHYVYVSRERVEKVRDESNSAVTIVGMLWTLCEPMSRS